MRPDGARSNSSGGLTGSFLGGTYALAVAAVVNRVLGAVYRVLLYGALQREGMGLLQMALPVYFLTVAVCTSGIRTATSRMVAEREARGRPGEGYTVFRTSLWLLSVLGFALSVALFGLSRPIARYLTKDPRSVIVLAAIAPGIFFEAVTAAYRGLFHGRQRMWPAAVSQIVEQVIRMGTTFLLVFALLPIGIEMAAAGAAAGSVIGSVAGFVSILWAHSSSRERVGSRGRAGTHDSARLPGRRRLQSTPGSHVKAGSEPLLREMARIAAPVSLVTILLSATRVIDVAVIPLRLQTMGLSVSEATALYGQLTGGAMPLVTLPTVITAALQVSLVPAVTRAQATRDVARIRRLLGTAFRITVSLMLPAAAGLYVLSEEIPRFLYKDPGLAPIIAVMAATPLLMSLEQVTSGGLQGLGRFSVMMRNLLLAAGAQTAVTYSLTALPRFGIIGAAYGMITGCAVGAGLNFISLAHETPGLVADSLATVLRPAISALFMGVVVRYSYGLLAAATHLESVALIGSGGLGAVVYLLMVGGITAIRRAV